MKSKYNDEERVKKMVKEYQAQQESTKQPFLTEKENEEAGENVEDEEITDFMPKKPRFGKHMIQVAINLGKK